MKYLTMLPSISLDNGTIAPPVCGIPIAVGGDAIILQDIEENTYYYGLTRNIGVGTPGLEFHVEWGGERQH